MILVISIIFQKATSGADPSEVYARLFLEIKDNISPAIHDDNFRTLPGNGARLIPGPTLFRYSLWHRCEKDLQDAYTEKRVVAEAVPHMPADSTEHLTAERINSSRPSYHHIHRGAVHATTHDRDGDTCMYQEIVG